MKRNSSIISLIILLHIGGFAFAAINKVWIDRSQGLTEGKVNCLFVGGKSRAFVLAGTDKALYRSDITRKSFQPVLQLYGNFKTINQVQSDTTDASTLYSATDGGVFVSRDQGLTWENIFSPSSATARKVFCVLAVGGNIYAGTADGLYVRNQGEVVWKKETNELGRSLVFHLADGGDFIYAATDTQVYRLEKSTGELRQVFVAIDRHDDVEELIEDGEPIRKLLVKDLVAANGGQQIFAVIGQELLVSEDNGDNWDNWITENLPVEFVRKLYVQEQMYAATDKGVFFFENDRWENDVNGLPTSFVNDVAVDQDGKIFLATVDGVFMKGSDETATNIDYANVSQYFMSEPTVSDVQKMAIGYANVNPEQITSWHNQARSKALLPSLSLGVNRADTELYHWDTGGNPDTLVRGRDYLDWSTSLSWDFSDLIWSSDRTSIDSRSKSMSELRQDILDQVTRLYFERRRIQIELASVNESDWDREMRIEELTALIDGLTGGEFSRQVAKDSPVKKSKHKQKGEGNG